MREQNARIFSLLGGILMALMMWMILIGSRIPSMSGASAIVGAVMGTIVAMLIMLASLFFEFPTKDPTERPVPLRVRIQCYIIGGGVGLAICFAIEDAAVMDLYEWKKTGAMALLVVFYGTRLALRPTSFEPRSQETAEPANPPPST